ncbi:anti-sigma factor family protein [Streptomyces radiopugnans]|uniref:anti-sigma factor family protein n=1 Tax=Streptomyces radiopugnans TaxID=403935 RepID=UPI003F1D1830
MTSMSSASFGADGHPEVDEISDLTEGLLSPERSADVRAHLSGCALCADVRASLEEIRDMLGTLPEPIPMPSDVAGRIDAALAAEALLNASSPSDGESRGASPSTSPVDTPNSVSRETIRSGRPSGRSAGRPAGRPQGAKGPGRADGRRPRRRHTALLGTAGAAALLTLGAVFLPGLGGSSSGGMDKSTASDAGAQGDRNDQALEARVRSLLADSKPGKPEQESQGTLKETDPGSPDFSLKASPGSPSAPAATMPQCIREGVDRDEVPLAVGMSEYEGRQAYIVVLPDEADGSRVDAYVVDAGCVGKVPPIPGMVLTIRTYPR